MDMEKAKEAIGQGIIKAFEMLSFNPESIYKDAQGHTIAQWRHKQEAWAGATGAGAAVIPGLHIPALGIDIGVLINRMGECAYGIGAIIGGQKSEGNILEKEDLANILALWGGHMTVYELEKVATEDKGGRFASSAVQLVWVR